MPNFLLTYNPDRYETLGGRVRVTVERFFLFFYKLERSQDGRYLVAASSFDWAKMDINCIRGDTTWVKPLLTIWQIVQSNRAKVNGVFK